MSKRHIFFVVLSTLVFGIAAYSGHTYLEKRPKGVSHFEGISLGDSKDLVFYALGAPSNVLFADDSSSEWRGSLQVATEEEIRNAKEGHKSFNFWSYDRRETRLDIDFDDSAKVISIGCYYDNESGVPPTDRCLINNVGIFDQEGEVVEKLGVPDRETLNGITKTVAYERLNLELFFTKRRLYQIKVTNFEES
jgi:hypothetical protein